MDLGVQEIWQIDERSLGIKWTDSREDTFDVVHLRRACPCAVCVDEHTGKRILKDSSVEEGVRPTSLKSIGRYALSMEFTDGHRTGIYTFEYLRKIKN